MEESSGVEPVLNSPQPTVRKLPYGFIGVAIGIFVAGVVLGTFYGLSIQKRSSTVVQNDPNSPSLSDYPIEGGVGKTPTPIQETSPVFNEDIVPLLEAFARKNWRNIIVSYDERFGMSGNLLLEALHKPTPDLPTTIETEKQTLTLLPLADAPDVRAASEANTKLCLAMAVVRNELKNTAIYCEISPSFLNDPTWEEVDDITAAAEVIPFFVTGFGYYQAGEYEQADFYFDIVLRHQEQGHAVWGESYFGKAAGDLYQRIIELSDKYRQHAQ